MSFSKNYFFSVVMSSPGGPGMVVRVNFTPKALHHGDNCVVNLWCETKNSANWCAQQSWGIPRKTSNLILLTLYFLLKLTYLLVKSAYRQFNK